MRQLVPRQDLAPGERLLRLREGTEHGDHRSMRELSLLIRRDDEALKHLGVSLNHGGLLVDAQEELKHAASPAVATPVGVREIGLFDHTLEPISHLLQLPYPDVHARVWSKAEGEVASQNAQQVLLHRVFERDLQVCCSLSEVFGLKERPESSVLPADEKRQSEETGVPLE